VIVSLDAGALDALAGSDSPERRRVRQAMEAARRTGRDVVAATLVLAELYRGPRRAQRIDALLSRHEGAIVCRDTDRRLARLVGGILHAGASGSEDIVDAHVVAAAVDAGGGIVLTGDVDDLARLSAPYPAVVVEHLSGPARR
jgi:predicted nucleic acid-binding protein